MTIRPARLGDVLTLRRSRVSIREDWLYRQIGVYSWGKGLILREPVPGSELSKINYYSFPEHALIISNIQAWEAAITVSPKNAFEFVASQRFLPYVPTREGEVDTRYVCEFLLSEVGMDLVRKASPGSVTRNRTLGIKAFENIVIPLPDIVRQKEIADHIGQLKELNAKRASTFSLRMDSLGQSILNQAKPAKATRLAQFLVEDKSAVTVDRDDTYAVAGVLNKGRGIFRRPSITGRETKYAQLCRIHSGQLVYSKLKAFEGAIGLVRDEHDGYFVSKEFPRFNIDVSVVNPVYLEQIVRSPYFANQMKLLSSGIGARRERLKPEAFLSMSVDLPSIDVQTSLANLFQSIDRIMELSLRRSILQITLPLAARNEIFNQAIDSQLSHSLPATIT